MLHELENLFCGSFTVSLLQIDSDSSVDRVCTAETLSLFWWLLRLNLIVNFAFVQQITCYFEFMKKKVKLLSI